VGYFQSKSKLSLFNQFTPKNNLVESKNYKMLNLRLNLGNELLSNSSNYEGIRMPVAIPTTGPQAATLTTVTETQSFNVIGPASFLLSDLRVEGVSTTTLAASNSPYIIGMDEGVTFSVKVMFDHSALTTLLMCLGTSVKIGFAVEGFGKGAAEVDLEETITTTSGVFDYVVNFTSTPRMADLTPGFYKVAAVATIGPVTHECGQLILGYGYIGEFRFQVF